MNFKIKRNRKSISEVMREKVAQQYACKEKEVAMRHSNYLKVLSAKVYTRNDTIMNWSWESANSHLRTERNILKSKLWVATSKQHLRRYERYWPYINCHVKCQDRLGEQINELRASILNVKCATSHTTRKIYALNRQTVPNSQNQHHVAKARKRMQMLENRLEVGVRRECEFMSQNAAMRDELIRILNNRAKFNAFYMKMVQRLNFEKKYLTDLIEYTLTKFEHCIEVYEKMEALRKRERREIDAHRLEMEAMIRNTETNYHIFEFRNAARTRPSITNLKSKQHKKLEIFVEKHTKKINLYNEILDQILNYTKSRNVKAVINKIQEQESCYYSYFNYSNEMGYHMTLLNNAVNRLYTDIDGLKQRNRNTVQEQLQTIADLEQQLAKKKANNQELKKKSDDNDARIDNMLTGIQLIQNSCNVKAPTPKLMLGNFSQVNLLNMRQYLKLIERRLIEIVAVTYIMERMDESKTYSDYVVKDIDKICDWTTNLNDIVLTQQCAECAENEAFDMENVRETTILSKDEVRKKVYERVQQPEMQYCLHSLSNCRLPRSRLIATKKGNTRGA